MCSAVGQGYGDLGAGLHLKDISREFGTREVQGYRRELVRAQPEDGRICRCDVAGRVGSVPNRPASELSAWLASWGSNGRKIPLGQSGQIDHWHSLSQLAFLELDGNDAVLMWKSGKLRAGWWITLSNLKSFVSL
jgi:hypothetical protein